MSAVIILVALGLALFALIYFNASVNARANREDEIVSITETDSDIDALSHTIAAAAGQPAIPGNAVEMYQNGNEIFPPMLESISEARSSVHFVTYVYGAGAIPTKFADAFSNAARRGVEVRIVLDRHGAKETPAPLIARVCAAGCDVQWFRPARWYDWTQYNRRTHRRLLIVDGAVGFTGGVGIADEWSGAGDSPRHWRDTHLRISGPAVAALRWLDHRPPAWTRPLIEYGRVPFFYFFAHFFLLHAAAAAGALVRYHSWHWFFESANMGAYPFTRPPGWGYSLPVVYTLWIVVVVSLYPACKRMAQIKATGRYPVLRYF